VSILKYQPARHRSSPGLETWAPEKVDSYEIGSKTSFHGWIQGYFNLAAFYNNFTNQQLFGALIANPNSGQIGGVAVINAGKSHLEGIEVDSAIAPIQSLQIDLGYTWLKTKVVALTPPALGINSPYLAIIPTASVGDSLPYSPKNKVSITGTYLLPIPERRRIGRRDLRAYRFEHRRWVGASGHRRPAGDQSAQSQCLMEKLSGPSDRPVAVRHERD
jgi:outer membrane receptor protein involved in Fe transport